MNPVRWDENPVMVEGVARAIHDANTGRITPDPEDPTPYAKLARAALEMAQHLVQMEMSEVRVCPENREVAVRLPGREWMMPIRNRLCSHAGDLSAWTQVHASLPGGAA